MNDTPVPLCALCGEPMPESERMFKFHGFSGPCPKPPLPPKPRDEFVPTRLFDPKITDPAEPVFLLRAQDAQAADLVELWALRAKAAGCKNDKVRSAFSIAEEMRRWPIRKEPD